MGLLVPHGFHVENSKASRLERWRERREARAFEELVTRLRRVFHNKGVCRHCAREVGLIPGVEGSVTRYHRDNENKPCVGRGRASA
jgi:hypothetical protein